MKLKTLIAKPQKGVTLLELMIATAILAIILTVAIPSFSDIGDSQRVIGATEQIYNHIQQVRSEAITANTFASINFDTDGSTTWVYGFSTVNNNCDLTATTPSAANACVIIVDDGDGTLDPGDGSVDLADLVLARFSSATDWDDVSVTYTSVPIGSTQISFDPVRGTSSSGIVNLTSANGKDLRIMVSLLGRPTVCSPDGDILNYKTC